MYNKGTFCVTDSPRFEGITDGQHWNGWACPMFTLETMKKIQEWIGDKDGGRIDIEGNQVFDVFEDERTELTKIVVEGITYYSIDGWCWDEITGDQE